jgi:enoyl-CoA hydratase/carnithine racemase
MCDWVAVRGLFPMNDILETKREGRVLRVWLNRPTRHNSLTTELCRELVQALDGAEKDGSVGSILVTGRGDSFCAGMELGELATGDIEKVSRLQETLFTVGARLTKPLIGAVHGPALGGGTGVVANCHVVIASENATFGLTGIRMGLWPFVFFHAVSAAVGERRALALTITGELLNAAEALRIGLVHQVVPIEEVELCALELAQTVANYSSNALRSGLAFVQAVQGQPWKAAASAGRLLRDEFFKSAEFQADLTTFLHHPVPPLQRRR